MLIWGFHEFFLSNYSLVYKKTVQASYIYHLNLWSSSINYWVFLRLFFNFLRNIPTFCQYTRVSYYYQEIFQDFHERYSSLFLTEFQVIINCVIWISLIVMGFALFSQPYNIIQQHIILISDYLLVLGNFEYYHYGISIYFGSLTNLSYLLATCIYLDYPFYKLGITYIMAF